MRGVQHISARVDFLLRARGGESMHALGGPVGPSVWDLPVTC
jgi:hypothetical protein